MKFCDVYPKPYKKFQLEILTINVISGMVYFRELILESSRNVCETPLAGMLRPFQLGVG